jgi:hypothetical protein
MSLSWARSIQTTSPCNTPLRPILIRFSHLRLDFPSGLFLSGLPAKFLDALSFRVRNAVTLFHYFDSTNGSVQVRSFVKCFVTWWFVTVKSCLCLAQPPSWRTTPCRLSATAYSVYSQLPSITKAVPTPENWGRAMVRCKELTTVISLANKITYFPFW